MSSELSESLDNKDEDDYKTGAKEINGSGDGNDDRIGDRNTGAVGGSTEWLRFLRLRARTEAFGAMARAKPSP